MPQFDSPDFLRQHIDSILAFYAPNSLDAAGGFYHYFLDDGSVYNTHHRHLVSATRWLVNAAAAYHYGHGDHYRDWAAHALAELHNGFLIRSGDNAGDYAWTMDYRQIEDGRVMAYGQGFVLLAMSWAHRLGLCSHEELKRVFVRINTRFYEAKYGAYSDERSDTGTLSDYRGQNANMHLCEACLAAFEATVDRDYLERAIELAETFAFRLSSDGPIWEHYHHDWTPDWDYNRDNPGDIFKPWGVQTGHQTEWAKLLLILDEHDPDPRWLARAQTLHAHAWSCGWDAQHGGLIYGYDLVGQPCDRDKYFWVQAESFASAWRLYRRTGEAHYLAQYHAIWEWSWEHLVDHKWGAWYRIVAANGNKRERTKSPAGKVDYHTMGACWDVLRNP